MSLLYEIDQTALNVEHYLRVYTDHIELRKPDPDSTPVKATLPADSVAGNVLKVAKYIDVDMKKDIAKTQYFELNVTYDQIKKVVYKPANGTLATGMLHFVLKGKPEKRVTQLNVAFAADAINFNKKHNDTALKIKEYVEKAIKML